MNENYLLRLQRQREIQIARLLCARAPAPPEGWTWKGTHRKPPLPFYDAPPVRGQCRICAQPIYTGGHYRGTDDIATRCTWHSVCSSAYLFWMNPSIGTAGLHQNYRCGECGERTGSGEYWGGGEVDHTIPLYRVRRDYSHLPWFELLRFWSPENLKVLCSSCHKTKCAAEAQERATYARIDDSQLQLI